MPKDLSGSRSSATVRGFEAQIRQGAARCGLDAYKGPLLVGFSGGADSTALLLSLSSLMSGRGGWPSSLVAVHVNHGLRAETAERDAAHAASFCADRELPFHRVDVQPEDLSVRGLEAAARKARHTAFLDAAQAVGAKSIALAHSLDDQAETVLMHLFEGAGVRGLTGIRPQSNLQRDRSSPSITVYRPMLQVPRAEARAYLEAQGVRWVEDESNLDDRFLRNRLRIHLIPSLEANWGDDVMRRIAASADHVSAALDVLNHEIEKAREECFSESEGELCISPLSRISRLPQAIRVGVWEAVLKELRERGKEPRKRIQLERLVQAIDQLVLKGGPASKLDLPGGLEARRTYDAVWFGPPKEIPSPPEGEVPLLIPGHTSHPGWNLEIEAILDDQFPGSGDGKWTVCLDGDSLKNGLVLRARREGDRFHPAGAPGEKKLKEFFIDHKIPRIERDRVLLVTAGNQIVWLVGWAVSEKFSASPQSSKRVVLRVSKWPETPEIKPGN